MIKTTLWEKRATAHSQTKQLRDRLNEQQNKNCHFDLRKQRPHQCQTLVEKVQPVHQNDTLNRSIEDGKLQRSAPTIQRPIGKGNKRRLHLGNDDAEDSKIKGTKFPTITPSLRNI